VRRWAPRIVLALVAVVWLVVTAVAVTGTWDSLRRPDREPLRAHAPSLRALDVAVARAQPFLDGLYSPRADGSAAIAEYYGLPVRARFGAGRPWQLLGDGENRIDRLHTGETTEVGAATFRDGAAELTGRLAVDWRAAPGRARIVFTPESLRGARSVTLRLQDRRLATVRARDVGRRRSVLVPLGDRATFRSHRFTVRHATNDGEQYERYRGHPARSGALGRTSRAGGFPAGRDIYSAMWNASGGWGDEAPFSTASYADCRAELAPDAHSYEYVSKTCAVPTRTFVWLSSFDPLARMLQGLHVLGRHRDPGHRYRDLDHEDVSVAGEIARWEALFRGQDGIPRCSPLSCDTTWSSGVRTAVFGALSTELGYGLGDRVSRTYADRAAAVLVATQIPPSGEVRSAYGTFHRPLEAGGFAIAWRRSMLVGFSPKLLARSQDRAANELSMPSEYVGFVASNAETAMADYAFLVRYRCWKYAAGCRAQFAPQAH
jgi:hypothetical protein